jgi:tRNA threonylcarbamoyladenosine biosynthesis protein TsaB
MKKILCIETSEKLLSVALSMDGNCLAEITEEGEQNHAKYITILSDKILKDNNLTFKNLDAICVNAGPGSYTGLRIGVSTAKGFCWANDLPLLSLCTGDILAEAAKEKYINQFDLILSTLDARRNEVFISVSDNKGEIKSTESMIIDENSLNDYTNKKIIIVGSGAEKFRNIIQHTHTIDATILPKAKNMCKLAFDKLAQNKTDDVVYFEPKYFKAVHTSISKKKIFE